MCNSYSSLLGQVYPTQTVILYYSSICSDVTVKTNKKKNKKTVRNKT
uniref:Uncharacterized protein n=1 Tax=Anguilla anguilla TaxID=7936 RepID=A0A0E9RY68_ANGAN